MEREERLVKKAKRTRQNKKVNTAKEREARLAKQREYQRSRHATMTRLFAPTKKTNCETSILAS